MIKLHQEWRPPPGGGVKVKKKKRGVSKQKLRKFWKRNWVAPKKP